MSQEGDRARVSLSPTVHTRPIGRQMIRGSDGLPVNTGWVTAASVGYVGYVYSKPNSWKMKRLLSASPGRRIYRPPEVWLDRRRAMVAAPAAAPATEEGE